MITKEQLLKLHKSPIERMEHHIDSVILRCAKKGETFQYIDIPDWFGFYNLDIVLSKYREEGYVIKENKEEKYIYISWSYLVG